MPMKNYFGGEGTKYLPSRQRKIHLRLFAILMAFACSVSFVYSQNARTIKGKVLDELNEPIIGASVTVENTTTGTITDLDGAFSISVPEKTIRVKISYVGYVSQTVDVSNTNTVNVTLKENFSKLDEVVVVGYGMQKKVNLIGSVSAIGNEELTITKNTNVQNMLTGKLPGVRVVQKTAEPGEFTNQFDIRGFGNPLLVVDGVPRGDLVRMDPNEIESISILKDASAAIYGVRAANGVVLVTTKKGERGKAKIEYSMYYGIQTPAEVLRPVGAYDRAVLMNEISMRKTDSPSLVYNDEYFQKLANGEMPDTDWYDLVLRGSAPQQQHNVSISGGSEKIDYYVNFGYTDQESFLKSNSSNYNRYNLRTNLNAEITKNLKASVKLNAIIDENNRQSRETAEIFSFLWRSRPNDPLYANNNPDYYYHPDDIPNVIPLINTDYSGFISNKKTILQSNFELAYTVPYVEGLVAKGMFSYDKTINDNTNYNRVYKEYRYVDSKDLYTEYPINNITNLNRYYAPSFTRLWQVSLNYNRKFLDTHNVNALLVYEESYNQGYDFSAFREFSIDDIPYIFAGNSQNQRAGGAGLSEYASRALVGRLNYDYKGKYLAEFSFRYDGSSKFPKNKQWGFFPSGFLAWRISEEPFIKDNIAFIDNLKIRGSYGILGDDGAANFQFVEGFDYPVGTSNTIGKTRTPTGAVFGDSFVNGLGFRNAPNYDITWYTSRILNLAMDGDLWNGLLGFTFEVFQRDRKDLLANPTNVIPGTFGAGISQTNLEEDRTKGFELELRHHYKIGSFRYNVSGYVSMTRNMWTKKAQPNRSNSWDYWRNNQVDRYNDIWFGKGAAGQYQSWADIENSYYANSATLPGDYIYEDWNGDGVIDDRDDHPIATTTNPNETPDKQRNYPLMNFGFTVGGDYKGMDFSLLFQGAAKSYVSYGEQMLSPLGWDGNALDYFMDRWHPENPKQDPYEPSVNWINGDYAYGKVRPEEKSEFNIQDGKYLRLKSAEVGYTLPKTWLQGTGVQRLRVYFNAYNLLTFTGVKSVDPEKPSERNGYLYPLNRSYNFGASLTF